MNMKIKIRKSWGQTNPVTRKIDSKKVYSRRTKFEKRFDGEWIVLYLVSTMMEARINTDKIKISKPVAIEGQLWFHVDVPNGWDDVKKIMTKVIEVNNIDFKIGRAHVWTPVT